MRAGGVVLALTLAAVAPLAAGQAYKWVDENGKTHYGDKPPAQRATTEVAPPTSSGIGVSGSGSGDVPRKFSECVSQICGRVSRADPTCRTTLCQEAMSLPDDCHTIMCQSQRADIEKRIAQMDQAKRGSTGSTPRSTTAASTQAADAARARAGAVQGQSRR
jgi:hypothetical protein